MSTWSEVTQLRVKPIKESYLFKVYRALSLPLTFLFSKLPVTPNMVTLLGFLLYAGAAALIAYPSTASTRLGGALIILAFTLDLVDGELARVTGKTGPKGAWLDGIFDRIGDVLILGGMSIYLYQVSPNLSIVVLGLAATVSSTLWRQVGLQTKIGFSEPEVQGDMKPFGFDVAMQSTIWAVGALLLQVYWVLLFFAVVVNLVWVKNIIVTYLRR